MYAVYTAVWCTRVIPAVCSAYVFDPRAPASHKTSIKKKLVANRNEVSRACLKHQNNFCLYERICIIFSICRSPTLCSACSSGIVWVYCMHCALGEQLRSHIVSVSIQSYAKIARASSLTLCIMHVTFKPKRNKILSIYYYYMHTAYAWHTQ